MAITRLSQLGIGAADYVGFQPKNPASVDKITRLTLIGIGGKRVEFEPKTPVIVSQLVTRLTQIGIGGKRLIFLPKTAAEVEDENTPGIEKKTKVYTPREIEGIKAMFPSFPAQVPELHPVLEQVFGVEVEPLEAAQPDIGLILAIFYATGKKNFTLDSKISILR